MSKSLCLFSIAREVAVEGVSKKDSEEISRRLISVMVDLLCEGRTVNIPEFGKFKIKEIPAREYRNPKTGEKVSKKATRKVVFTRTRGSMAID